MDRKVRFQFQGEASLFSDKSSSVRDALILTADEHITRSILTTAPLDDHIRVVIVHIFCILFITLLHLSYNKSANFLVLNIYFAEDNNEEKEN